MTASPQQVEMYRTQDGTVELAVRADGETVWLSRQQLATLFGRDVKTIGKHISNAGREELAGISTVAKFATVQPEGDRVVTRQLEHYSLDMILSVGYRVKSTEGVHFRRWANSVLKKYLVEGAAINERRLEQLGSIVRILSRSTDELVAGVADVLSGYLPGLTLLRDYDDGRIDTHPSAVPGWTLTIEEARTVISQIAAEFQSDGLFGRERGEALDGVIAAIYQSFGGKDLYPTVEEKAANVLYLVVKDHPFADGNKRSAAALFVTFLARNGVLQDEGGNPRITNNALAAITLMVAMSDPREKDLMVSLLIRMITEGSDR
ncbi:virulence RhuM family protein [Hoyosella sp. YIM 151337]|uniref:RhuM family protein n=1 Tax=Hoyosella sp. YIM 151337 TaxID=2992742 RepID=UPI00223612BB|nr:RhuM family protein [Hoyosella sp. YIM 151337]MCW4355921.1 virulence RhuM family protein [Hoyosella sp. YIM 151337]